MEGLAPLNLGGVGCEKEIEGKVRERHGSDKRNERHERWEARGEVREEIIR